MTAPSVPNVRIVNPSVKTNKELRLLNETMDNILNVLQQIEKNTRKG